MVNEFISDRDPALQIEEEDFSPDVDSTVLFRERTRGSKLEGTFAKQKSRIVSESGQTITILPDKGKHVILSNRDVAVKRDKTTKSGKRRRKKEERPQCSKMANTKILAERRVFLAPSSSSEEENDETEMSVEVKVSSKVGKEPTLNEPIEDEQLYPNPIPEPEETTEVEEG